MRGSLHQCFVTEQLYMTVAPGSCCGRWQVMPELSTWCFACREMRTLLRRYPDFPDMRAALAAALWGVGKVRGQSHTAVMRLVTLPYSATTPCELGGGNDHRHM
jgi:hypothetical protein